MTLSGAIEILSDDSIPPELRWDSKFIEAKQLGIEALKRERKHRKNPAYYGSLMLSGETEE